MPAFSISYDISDKSNTTYEKIEKIISDNCSGWCRYAESSWIVSFSGNAEALAKKIQSTGFGKDDNLLVIKVLNEMQGWLSDDKWEAIKSFFNKQ